jgi:murein DD-endopeptidase MepM/ murein hydrolase activator NlpD
MATQESIKPRDEILSYTILSGDTLSLIAKKFDVSENTIVWANELKGKNPILKPGQTLKIPPVTGVVHKVKRGETVYSIAKKYDVDPQLILNYPFNDFVDLDTFALAVGQNLIIPEGVMPQEATGNPSVTRPPAPQYLAREGAGKLLFPTTGSISQNPVWYHMALDIANRASPDVYAAESGTIVSATCLKWGYGCHIVVDHGGGMQTLYAHLSRFYVTGGKVDRGQAIGRMGSTGRSTGTHLHFEVRIGGHAVNPWGYVK